MIQWEFGFYTMLAIATTITMGVLAARLFYSDRRYRKKVEEHGKFVEAMKGSVLDPQQDTEAEPEEILEYLIVEHHEMEKYTHHKNNNRNLGAIIDMAAILSFMAMGMAIVIGIGRESVPLLATFSGIVLLIPLVHFSYHLNVLRKSNQP